MKVSVNGKTMEVTDGVSLMDLVASFQIKPEMVIVEVNEMVVKRDRWPETILADGDIIELVTFVGGG